MNTKALTILRLLVVLTLLVPDGMQSTAVKSIIDGLLCRGNGLQSLPLAAAATKEG
jgi:hypothetical protein